MRHILFLVMALLLAPQICLAGETLDTIRKNGAVRCGVDTGMPGFAVKGPDGKWTGMDIDYCRAVAAALLGDPEKCFFLPLTTRARFTSLLAREVDLLSKRTTWTVGREAAFQVLFVGAYYLTGQGFLVRAEDAPQGIKSLEGQKVAVAKGSTHEQNLPEVAAAMGVRIVPVIYDDFDQARDAFFKGECRGLTGDQVVLAVSRVQAPGGPEPWALLPKIFAKEPLSPVARLDDDQWVILLRAVLAVLLSAEEYGLTRDNVRAVPADNLPAMQLLQRADAMAKSLGVAPGWAVRVIAAVGNYGEIFDRHLGAGSPFKLERGRNRLWNNGGLLWSPPF